MVKTKNCKTKNELIRAIEEGEPCCLKFTKQMATVNKGTIIYLESGVNLVWFESDFKEFGKYLEQA